MELKAGYKMTEVGVIPEDWEVVELGQIASFTSGFGINIAKLFIHSSNNLIPVYGGNGIAGYTVKSTINIATVVVGRVGQKCGEVYLTNGPAWITDNALYPKTFYKKVNIDFLGKAMQFSGINNLKNNNDLPLITQSILHSIKISLPNLIEQTAIVNALSDADAFISSLEKLIAKKRKIKQGAMQKLLQPKEGWEVKRFSDVCWFQEGPGLRNWQFTKSGIKVINVTNLENGILNLERTARYISLEEFQKMYQHFEINENDILVASSGSSYGKVALVRRKDLPLVMNTSVIRFQPLKELDFNFLWTFLKSNQFKDQIDLLITGGAQPNFGPVHLNKVYINMPASMEEQIQIATVFYDMDAEIDALQTKLEKYRNIKLGMMQNLLTGKIRLV